MRKSMIILLSLILLLSLSFSALAALPAGHPQYDLGGETITIVFPWTEFGDLLEGEGLAWKEDVEEAFNCTFELTTVNWQDMAENLTASVMAGDPLGDILWVSKGWMWGYLEDGILYPMQNELETLNFYERMPEMNRDYMKSNASYFGKIYAFGNYASGGEKAMVWNKTLFEDEGLPNLYDLYEAGEWNFDNFLDIAIQATQDTDSDGEIDQWGFGTAHGTDSGRIERMPWEEAMYFGFANGGYLSKEIDGVMTYTGNQEEFITGIKLARQLAVNDVLAPQPSSGLTQEYYSGQVAMFGDDPSALHDSAEEGMEDEYGFILYPKGPDADEHIAIGRGDLFYMVMPISTDQAEAKIEATSALFKFTEPYLDLDEYADDLIQGYAEVAGDRETLEMLEEYFNKNEVIFHYKMPGVMGATKAAVDGEQDVASAYDAISSRVQTFLDELVNTVSTQSIDN